MNTVIYSLIGVITLIGISLFFSYLGNKRNTKWENRINAIRRATIPDREYLRQVQKKTIVRIVPQDFSAQNRKINNNWLVDNSQLN